MSSASLILTDRGLALSEPKAIGARGSTKVLAASSLGSCLVFVSDDTAQIVVYWSIDGKGPDGEDVHLGGSASDIVRRGADGFWRYIIDNNQGTAVRQPA